MYLREGYGSLHAYCCHALGLSDGEAYNRIEVARAARRFPVILEIVREAATSRGRQSLEFASSFRNEFASGKADDGRPGMLPKQA